MTGRRRRLGRAGERVAARHLKRRGLNIIARNWRCGRLGEVDIIARDGDSAVIVEVRTRRAGAGPWSPESSITPAKRARLRRLADAWSKGQQRWRPRTVRVDLVAVERRGFLRWTVRWHKAIG